MSIKVVCNPVVAQWVVDRGSEHLLGIKSVSDLGHHVAYGVVRDVGDRKEAICGVIYNNYRTMPHGNDCCAIIHAEHPGWCQRRVLRELFWYPFEVAGCERLTAAVRDGNTKSLEFLYRLGFRKEGVLRKGWNGKTNAILLGMLKSECRWLEGPRSGQKGQFAADAAADQRRPDGNRAVGSKHRSGKRKRAA